MGSKKQIQQMKLVFTIAILLTTVVCNSQTIYGYDKVENKPEYIQVKILKIRTIAPVTIVKMKTLARPRMKFTTECTCNIPYRKRDIVWIIKPGRL
jgi:hypothetical protein